GNIKGGLSADCNDRAYAIEFTDGDNRLELQKGSNLSGDVVANGSHDTLALGGDNDASFDVDEIGNGQQYQGFDTFEKTGDSTWTLTGSTNEATPWTIKEGHLTVTSTGALGRGPVLLDASGLISNSTFLIFDGSDVSASDLEITVDNGKLLFSNGASAGSANI